MDRNDKQEAAVPFTDHEVEVLKRIAGACRPPEQPEKIGAVERDVIGDVVEDLRRQLAEAKTKTRGCDKGHVAVYYSCCAAEEIIDLRQRLADSITARIAAEKEAGDKHERMRAIIAERYAAKTKVEDLKRWALLRERRIDEAHAERYAAKTKVEDLKRWAEIRERTLEEACSDRDAALAEVEKLTLRWTNEIPGVGTMVFRRFRTDVGRWTGVSVHTIDAMDRSNRSVQWCIVPDIREAEEGGGA